MSRAPRDLRNIVAESQHRSKTAAFEEDDNMLIMTLQQKLDAQRRELENRTDSISSIQRNFESLSQVYSEERQRINMLENALRQRDERIKALESELSQFQSVKGELRLCREQLISAKNSLAVREEETENCTKNMASMRTQISCLQELVSNHEEDSRKTSTALVNAKKDLDSAQSEISRLKAFLAHVESERQRMEASGMEGIDLWKKRCERLERQLQEELFALQDRMTKEGNQRLADLKLAFEREKSDLTRKLSRGEKDAADVVAQLSHRHDEAIRGLSSQHEESVRKLREQHEEAFRAAMQAHEAELVRRDDLIHKMEQQSSGFLEQLRLYSSQSLEWSKAKSVLVQERDALMQQVAKLTADFHSSQSDSQRALCEKLELERRRMAQEHADLMEKQDQTEQSRFDALRRQMEADAALQKERELAELRARLEREWKQHQEATVSSVLTAEQQKWKSMLENLDQNKKSVELEKERWMKAHESLGRATNDLESEFANFKRQSQQQIQEIRFLHSKTEEQLKRCLAERDELVEKMKHILSRNQVESVAVELKRTVAKLQAAEDSSVSIFTCMDCMDTMHDAIVYAPCGHSFCGKCAGRKSTCQECDVRILSSANNQSLDAILGKHEFRQQSIQGLAALSDKLLKEVQSS
eukprot:ANDGO_06655.mRNA.1 hypothetical protein TTHERM_00348770